MPRKNQPNLLKGKIKKSYKQLFIEFVKYLGAGTVFFWSTYALTFIFDIPLGWESGPALATASILGHIVYFAIDRSWVFNEDKSRRKTHAEFIKFAVFMTFNFFLNLLIVLGLEKLGLTIYLGQFVAAGFFTFWNFAGFKLWVFKAGKSKRKARHA